MFSHHNELIAAGKAFAAEYEKMERGDVEGIDANAVFVVAKMRMKSWKADKKMMKKEMEDMRAEVTDDEACITILTDAVADHIKTLKAASQTHARVAHSFEKWDEHEKKEWDEHEKNLRTNMKTALVVKKYKEMRRALFKKAIVVHSYTHNEDVAQAEKHFAKFLEMRADYEAYAPRVTEVWGNLDCEDIETLTKVIHKALSPMKLVVDLARPLARGTGVPVIDLGGSEVIQCDVSIDE